MPGCAGCKRFVSPLGYVARAYGSFAPMRRAAPAVGSLLALLLAAGLFFGSSIWVGAAALATAAALGAAGFLGRLPLARAGVALVGSLLALAAWSGISVAWSVTPDRSWDELNRLLVYAAFALLGLVLGSLGPRACRLAALVLGGALGTAILWALAGKAIPALFPDGGRAARLRDPVGYWNALALAGDALLVLGLWLASVREWRRELRAAGAVLAYAAVVATLLAVSRTGLVAAVAGVGLWLLLSGDRVERALLALAACIPGGLLAGWAFTRPGLVQDGQELGARVSAGAWFGGLFLLGAALVVLAAVRLERLRLAPVARRRVGRLLAAAAAVAVALAATAVLLVADPAGGESVQSPSRLGDASLNNRWEWWGEAWQLFSGAPLRGTGAGSFEIAHRRIQDTYLPASEPHDLPLQILAGTGILGFLFLAALVAAVAAAGRDALRRLAGAERDAAAALVAVIAVYGIHALVDFSWDFLAVTAPVLVAAGVLTAAGRPLVAPPARPFAAVALTALVLGSLVSLGTPWLAERSLEEVNRQLDAGDPVAAAEAARRARDLDPLSIEPYLKLAGVESVRGNARAARRAFGRAVATQPENPETWFALGSYEFGNDNFCNAYVHLNEAYTLDPASRRWEPGGPLDVARDYVNSGRCSR